jgi:hypothetical protein
LRYSVSHYISRRKIMVILRFDVARASFICSSCVMTQRSVTIHGFCYADNFVRALGVEKFIRGIETRKLRTWSGKQRQTVTHVMINLMYRILGQYVSHALRCSEC